MKVVKIHSHFQRKTLINVRMQTTYIEKEHYKIIMRLGFTCYLPSAALNALNKDNKGKNRNIHLPLNTQKLLYANSLQ